MYSFEGIAGQDAVVALSGEWPWYLGAVVIVSDENGNIVAQKTRYSSSSAKVSFSIENDGELFVWVSPYDYTSVNRSYNYSLSSNCAAPSCKSDSECSLGERCALPMCIKAPCDAPGTCVASPLCAEYTTSDGRFYAKNFAPGSYADAATWVTLDPQVVSSRIRNGVCDGQPVDTCDEGSPVCAAPYYADQFSTYASQCEFESIVRTNAGTAGESKGKFTAGVCAPICDYNDPHYNYIGQSKSQCMVIKFACPAGQFGFSNDCGCGCTDVAP
ncbi:MAG: hypothetical protein U0165_04405 [Polyangiaceae bacterium]